MLAILICSSCKSNSDFENQSDIIGNWIWFQSTGGISGETNTPDSTGIQIILEINSETIKRYENGELISELAYEIKYGESIRTTERIKLIIYENDWKQSFERHGKKLYLYDECADCFQNEYLSE